MEGKMIYVPYEDFVEGVKAKADLDTLRELMSTDCAYGSESIKAILRLPMEKENAETD
nr:MAG TPA: hypothetical protein [Caudoviricetes sp.]